MTVIIDFIRAFIVFGAMALYIGYAVTQSSFIVLLIMLAGLMAAIYTASGITR